MYNFTHNVLVLSRTSINGSALASVAT